MHGDRQHITPFGLAGGRNGGPNLLVLDPGTAQERSLGMDTAGLKVEAGTKLRYCSNGGGGFGWPHERPVQLVVDDVRAGYIDADIARGVYGVVFDGDGRVDEAATDVARSELAVAKPTYGLGPDETHEMGAAVRLSGDLPIPVVEGTG
jgi:N-methylhydantoinase B